MDCYYDCPCGHAHHKHNWFSGHGGSWCSADDCNCWDYHGHRLGDEPHYVIREGLVQPTGEMEADHAVQRVVVGRRAATAQQEQGQT